MATMPRLVNKQFNSPIGLYSQQNIDDTLTRHSQSLNNGAIGIDFNNPLTTKPANLANSAVLRMLEEEEQRQRGGQQGSLKRVAWPPPPEENGHVQEEAPVRQAAPVKLHQSPALSRLIPIEQECAPAPTKVYSPQPEVGFTPVAPAAKPRSPQPGFGARSPLSPQVSTPTQVFPPPLPESFQPTSVARQLQSSFAPVVQQIPKADPYCSLSPQPQRSPDCGFAAPPPASVSPRGWAPVSSPTPLVTSAQNQFVEPPPGVVTLRQAAPVHLPPPPIVTSQPATNSYRGGINMRGDQKWPPQSVKEAVAAENEARISLAKGPACRPRKVRKDYTKFFAQNALPHNYPGYRAPPGTQHFEDVSGGSSF